MLERLFWGENNVPILLCIFLLGLCSLKWEIFSWSHTEFQFSYYSPDNITVWDDGDNCMILVRELYVHCPGW